MATYEQNLHTLSKIENSLLSPPDPPPDIECPYCGSELLPDDDGIKCSNEDCDYSSYPDYEQEN